MATQHSTENESEENETIKALVVPAPFAKNTAITVMERIGQSNLYIPCLIKIQFRRDGKRYRIVRKELFAAPILKESI